MHFASQGHHNHKQHISIAFSSQGLQNKSSTPCTSQTTRFMAMMETMLHANNKPHHEVKKKKDFFSQLQCQAQLMPFTQGFSALPRVSEAFTPIIKINTHIQTRDNNKTKNEEKTKQNQGRISKITKHLHFFTRQ